MANLLDIYDTTRLIINRRFVEPCENEVDKLCSYIKEAGLMQDLLDELKYKISNLQKITQIASNYELNRIAQIEQGEIDPVPIREDIDWAELVEGDHPKWELGEVYWYADNIPDFPAVLTCSNARKNNLSAGNLKTVVLTYIALHNAMYDQTVAVGTHWKRMHLWGFQYTAILDDSTRPFHKSQHGVTAPKTSEFWSHWFPPNGYCCRCRCYPRYRKPDVIIEPKQLSPDPGFDFNPGSVRIVEGKERIEDMIQK